MLTPSILGLIWFDRKGTPFSAGPEVSPRMYGRAVALQHARRKWEAGTQKGFFCLVSCQEGENA